jgi:hypothetical protein
VPVLTASDPATVAPAAIDIAGSFLISDKPPAMSRQLRWRVAMPCRDRAASINSGKEKGLHFSMQTF